jgi:hypothetical protein
VIRDVLDVANELQHALAKELSSDEAHTGPPLRTVFASIHPETAIFALDTVEGKRFRITIEEEVSP